MPTGGQEQTFCVLAINEVIGSRVKHQYLMSLVSVNHHLELSHFGRPKSVFRAHETGDEIVVAAPTLATL